MKEFKAKLNLLFYFIIHFLKKPFVKRRGLQAFYESYREEGVVPVSKSDKLVLVASGRCINCGLCAQGISPLSTAAITTYHLPSSFAVAISREFPIAKSIPKFEGIEIGEDHCPCKVPLYSIARFLTKTS